MRIIHLLIVLIAVLVNPHLAGAEEPAGAGPVRVLFIGNSYTSVNNLPGMVQALAAAAKEKRKLEFVALTPGGWTLQRHLEDEKSDAKKRIAEGKWDFVVLQEQSQMPFMYPKQTLDFGQKLGALIKESKGKPVMYVTWARENQPENQAEITKTYTELGKALEAVLAPAGPAWEAARKERPALKLYNADQSHPSPAGTYLTACVFYSVIYGKSPAGLPGKLSIAEGGKVRLLADVAKADAALLQKVAWETAKGKE